MVFFLIIDEKFKDKCDFYYNLPIDPHSIWVKLTEETKNNWEYKV